MPYVTNDDGFKARRGRAGGLKPGTKCSACGEELSDKVSYTPPQAGYHGCEGCFEDGSLEATIKENRRKAEANSEPFKGSLPGLGG